MSEKASPALHTEVPPPQDRLHMAIYYLARGVSYEETSTLVNVPEHQLRSIMSFYGIRGRSVPKGARRMDIYVSKEAMPLVTSAAGLRGVDEVEIVERVIRLVFADAALLKGVLDDRRDVK